MKRLAFLMVFLLTGCPRPEQQSVIVNHRSEAMQVVYRGNVTTTGAKPSCEITKPSVASEEEAAGVLEWGEWNSNPEFSFDEQACEISVTLPAKSAVWISNRDSCGIRPDNPDFYKNWPSPIAMLRIESAQGTVTYSSWEVAKAFKLEEHWFGKDVCRLEISL